MADEPETTKPPKGKNKGDFLKKKVAGIPMPVILIGGAVVAYYLYSKYKSNAAASTSSAATPTASSGAPDGTSGGVTPGGGGYTDPGTLPSVGTVPLNNGIDPSTGQPWTGFGISTPITQNPAVTPIGKKTISIGGKSFNTVSGFMQNGATYLGINNPAEAKRLEASGVSLVHNPNDPNGKSLFVLIPKGASGPSIKKPPAPAVHATTGAVPGRPKTAAVIRNQQAAATQSRTANNAAAAPRPVAGTPNRRQILARTGQRLKTPKKKVPAK